MNFDFDAIVIGSGAAGMATARNLAGGGLNVGLIEKDQYLGGECPNYACIPTKTMLYWAKYYRGLDHANKIGLSIADNSVDWSILKAYKDETVSKTGARAHTKETLRQQNIELIRGSAQFVDQNTIAVNEAKYTAKHFVIATGSRPKIPNIAGIEKIPYLVSKTVLNLNELPESLIILGGGPVGVEFAQVFSSFGTDVTVLQGSDRILKDEEPEIANVVMQVIQENGVTVEVDFTAEKVEGNASEVTLHGLLGQKEVSFSAEKLMIATGRVPNIDGLGLNRIGIEIENGNIKVNEFLQSSIPHIWVAGDVSGLTHHTHTAHLAGNIISGNILYDEKMPYDFKVIPKATFFDPETASVGELEHDLIKAGKNIVVGIGQVSSLGRTLTGDGHDGLVKIIADKETGNVLGAGIVCDRASEMIGELALAIKARINVVDIASTLHAFPTYSEAIAVAAADAARQLQGS